MRSFKKLMAILLLLCFLILNFVPTFAEKSDISGHWAENEFIKWNQYGILNGDDNGNFRPDDSITRAEFVALINRVFGFIEMSNIKFNDVNENKWYSIDMSKSYSAGAITGDEAGSIHPEDFITRQEAVVILARIFDLEAIKTDSLEAFLDEKDTASWGKLAMRALVEHGYLKGRENNRLAPNNEITRAEAVKILDNIVQTLIKDSGTYTGNKAGNLIVNTPNVILKDMTIDGDLYLAQGIADGGITLINVTVKGRTIIYGGGELSIVIDNSVLTGDLIINKKDGKVGVLSKGSTEIANVELKSGALLVEENTSGRGFNNVVIANTIPANQQIRLNGKFEDVSIMAKDINVEVSSGVVEKMNISSTASNSELKIATDASVKTLTLDAPANVTGKGKIEIANINSNNVKLEISPKKINTKAGVEVASVPTQSTTTSVSNGGGGSTGGNVTPPSTPAEQLLQYESIKAKGNTITINYNETLDASSVPSPSDFKIVESSYYDLNSKFNPGITNVSIEGQKVILTLNQTVYNYITVLSYSKGQNPIRAAANKSRISAINGAEVRVLTDLTIETFKIDETPLESVTIDVYNENHKYLFSRVTDATGVLNVNDYEITYTISGTTAELSAHFFYARAVKESYEMRENSIFITYPSGTALSKFILPTLDEVTIAFNSVKSSSIYDIREALEDNVTALNLSLTNYPNLYDKNSVAEAVYNKIEAKIIDVPMLRSVFSAETQNEYIKEDIAIKEIYFDKEAQLLNIYLNKSLNVSYSTDQAVKEGITISENGQDFKKLNPQDIVHSTGGAISITFAQQVQSKNLILKITENVLKDGYGKILTTPLQTSFMNLEPGVINDENSSVLRVKKNTSMANTISLKIQLRDALLKPVTGVKASEFSAKVNGGTATAFDSTDFKNFVEVGNGIYTVDYIVKDNEYEYGFEVKSRNVLIEKNAVARYQ